MKYSNRDHIENLIRLGVDDYFKLVNKNVYYVKPSYGIHKVIEYDEDKEEFILDLDGTKFKCDPFRIILIK